MWRLEFDGSCWPNPGGKAGYGFILYHDGKEIARENGLVGNGPGMTNNLAEHYALLKGLELFQKKHLNLCDPAKIELEIIGDSQLVINQVNGLWKVSGKKPYSYTAFKVLHILLVLRGLGVKVEAKWVPREQNYECDKISR